MLEEKLDPGLTFSKVRAVVNGTIRCPTQARVYCSILHWDISIGNVMVDTSSMVRVIDWGYGKLLPDAGLTHEAAAHRRAVATKWQLEDMSILATSKAIHQSLTGTSLYMSIPVLCGAGVRGLLDDFESLFYVILHALSALENSKDPVICAFDFHESRNLAMVRTGCLASEACFLSFFGVTRCSDALHKLLCNLREYLFVSNGKYIAPDLVVDPCTPRGTDVQLLRGFIDEDMMSLLQDKETPLQT
ncbi:hypothetical protein IW152_003861 [Coemansia sp. BCRC 34962]|nr:hypothetical protein IW152_003861 [Coemansia sp. BCRC 34962]